MNTDNSLNVKKDNGQECIDLPSICDLSSISRMHASFTEVLTGSDLMIDAGSVERCGTAAVQVLVAASEELKKQGGRLVVTSASEQFNQAFQDVGLGSCLSEWE